MVKRLLKEKHIVIRERTPIETQLYAVFLYLGGLSLKGVKTRLLTVERSRTAIWTWIQQFGKLFTNKIADDLPDVIVADETLLQIKDMEIWFWFALDPVTRKILHFKITWNRTNWACKRFLEELEQKYGKKPKLVLTDGGPWYYILPRMGIPHNVISGGVRSYIERFNETLKDRTRMFDNYFPSTHSWVAGHTHRWMCLFLFYYNWIRSHMTFNDNSPILTDKGIFIRSEYQRFIYVLCEVVLC